jgi:rhodanese-related sulfurtransferase
VPRDPLGLRLGGDSRRACTKTFLVQLRKALEKFIQKFIILVKILKEGGIMRKVLAFVGGVLLLVNTAFAYDVELAKRFNAMFSQMTPEVIKQRPCEVDSKRLFEMIKNKEPFVFLDIRTPEEMSITGITWKDTLRIPMHELFKEENLKKLPKDKKIIVVCHTGTRAAAAALALRAVGFMNAYIYKGGIAELARDVGRNVIGE